MKTIAILAAAAAAMFAIPAASAAPVAVTSSSAPAVTATAIAASAQVRVVVGNQRRARHNRHHGRRAAWRRVCTNRWNHGRRHRVCRNVRYWR